MIDLLLIKWMMHSVCLAVKGKEIRIDKDGIDQPLDSFTMATMIAMRMRVSTISMQNL